MANDWEEGLFSCASPELCIKSFICAPVFLSLEKSQWDGTNCLLNFCSLNPIALRHQVRVVHGIEGSCVGDICTALFCGPCSLAQTMRTMRAQGPITKHMKS